MAEIGTLLGVVTVKTALKNVQESDRWKITKAAYTKLLQECGEQECDEDGIPIPASHSLDESSSIDLGDADIKHYMKQCQIAIQDCLLDIHVSDFLVLRMPLESMAVAILVSHEPCRMVCVGKTRLSSFHQGSDSERVAVFVQMDSAETANLILTQIAKQTIKISQYKLQPQSITSTQSEIQTSQMMTEIIKDPKHNDSADVGRQVSQQENTVSTKRTPQILTEVMKAPTSTQALDVTSQLEQLASKVTLVRPPKIKTEMKIAPKPTWIPIVRSQPSQVERTVSPKEPPQMVIETMKAPMPTSVPVVRRRPSLMESTESPRGPPPKILPKPKNQQPELPLKPEPSSPTHNKETQLYENIQHVQPVIREELNKKLFGSDVSLPPKRGTTPEESFETDDNQAEYEMIGPYSDEFQEEANSEQQKPPLPKSNALKGLNKIMKDLCEEEKLYIKYLQSLQNVLNITGTGNDFKRVIVKLCDFHTLTFCPMLHKASNYSKRDLCEVFIKNCNNFQIYEELLMILSKYSNSEHREEFTEIFLKTITRLQKYKEALCALQDRGSNDDRVMREAQEVIKGTLVRADNYLLIDSIKQSPFTPDQCRLLTHKGIVKIKNKNFSRNKSYLMILIQTHLIFAEKSSSTKKNKYSGCIRIDTLTVEGQDEASLTINGIFHPGSDKISKFKICAESMEAASKWSSTIMEAIQKRTTLPVVSEHSGPSVLI